MLAVLAEVVAADTVIDVVGTILDNLVIENDVEIRDLKEVSFKREGQEQYVAYRHQRVRPARGQHPCQPHQRGPDQASP